MYTAPKLIDLLEKQHQQRDKSSLFKSGTFNLQWRAKVGSFTPPDLETIISAGEPCGAWTPQQGCPPAQARPEDKRNVSDNYKYFRELPLHGYIPASSIRGIVRNWASKRPDIKPRMEQLLGKQENNEIQAGKIQFLDAYPRNPTKLTLDIVNPQEGFQVFHQGQSTPLSFYTLGDGQNRIPVKVAIRGIEGKATNEEVAEVWGWVQQALGLLGVGSRTASGYGLISTSEKDIQLAPNHSSKTLFFALYSQGCAGVQPTEIELRPTHIRGWLRSWVLRFFLGVMSQENAQKTVGQLLGSIEPTTSKGCVRIELIKGRTWGERSSTRPYFYTWKGKIQITAPESILNEIILPIVKFASSVGGLGKGWRRPLHIFTMNNGNQASRGCHFLLNHKPSEEEKQKPFRLSLTAPETWQQTYNQWLTSVKKIWGNQVNVSTSQNLKAEVFSPQTCSIYLVPYPVEEPINTKENDWEFTQAPDTRGEGMDLIYQEQPQRYKRNPHVGGDAGRGNAHCSWVSIKRVKLAREDYDCQEVVCVFLGGNHPDRQRFTQDLAKIQGATHLFGVR
jgi:CRISPR-associated protein Cmr6